MAKAIMIQGTASNVGKSVIAAGLIRIFHEDGYRTAPFKSQNMALNSFITPEGFEIGRAQAMQAEAGGICCDVRMNPLLLKPSGISSSQVIFMGKPIGDMDAAEYGKNKLKFLPMVKQAYESLACENDIIVIEGAGSPAEINLNENDYVNMGMAKIAGAPVVLVGDIDRGGVFASLYGTIKLVGKEFESYIKATLINKFRGDAKLLIGGIDKLEAITGVPCAGVVGYRELGLDDEDGLSERLQSGADKKSDGDMIDIAVINLPHIANFTDFSAFEFVENVRLRYVKAPEQLGSPDLLILPGTKNTCADLLFLKECGIGTKIQEYAATGRPVFGICGGYQMLGKTISDPLGVELKGEHKGLGLLDINTVFGSEKITKTCTGELDRVGGVFSSLSGKCFEGYEVHMGISAADKNIINAGNVYGTYIHGIFDTAQVMKELITSLRRIAGVNCITEAQDMKTIKERRYGALAEMLRESLDMKLIYKILDEGL